MQSEQNSLVEIDALRARTALTLRIGAVLLLIGSVGIPLATLVTIDPTAAHYYLRALAASSVTAMAVPILILIIAGGVSRGGGGSIATALVLTCLHSFRGLASMTFTLGIVHAIGIGWRVLPSLFMLAIAGWMAFAMIRLWWRERSLWPEPARIVSARSAWKRSRVALVVVWSVLLLGALPSLALGTIFYLEDPKGIGGGIGIVFVIFGALLGAFAVWMFILWLRLRRRGPLVARSTAWQVATVLLLWTLLMSAGGATPAPAGSIALSIPLGVLAWMLIELLHASLARNAAGAGSTGGFDVIALDENIPVAQIAAPPPFPATPLQPPPLTGQPPLMD